MSIGRALWLEERRTGLGGTDAAAILGLSRFAGPLEVYLSKTGQGFKKPETPAMRWGLALEDAIAAWYEEATKRKVWNPGRVIRHPEHPFLLGTPDRLVIGQERGVELKLVSTFAAKDWGRPGTDEVPPGYLIQCVHYMAVTGFPVWDVVPLIGGMDPRIYTVHRDADLEAHLVSKCVAFWHDHVLARVRPPLDAVEGTAKWLDQRFREDDQADALAATAEAEAWASRLHHAKEAIRGWEEEATTAENNLKDLMGEATVMGGGGWKATWRRPAPRKSVDVEKAVRFLAEALAETNTNTPHQREQYAQAYFKEALDHATSEQPQERRFSLRVREDD